LSLEKTKERADRFVDEGLGGQGSQEKYGASPGKKGGEKESHPQFRGKAVGKQENGQTI